MVIPAMKKGELLLQFAFFILSAEWLCRER